MTKKTDEQKETVRDSTAVALQLQRLVASRYASHASCAVRRQHFLLGTCFLVVLYDENMGPRVVLGLKGPFEVAAKVLERIKRRREVPKTPYNRYEDLVLVPNPLYPLHK